MDHAIRPIHKAHDASGPWNVDLRDAMSIPDPVAFAKVRAMIKLQHPAWMLKEIDRELRRNFSTLVLPHVPRLLPNPDITLVLYDDLCKVCGPIPDATTGEVANSVQQCIFYTPRSGRGESGSVHPRSTKIALCLAAHGSTTISFIE